MEVTVLITSSEESATNVAAAVGLGWQGKKFVAN